MRALGVLKNWIDAGTLPAVRIGRRVRIKRSDFDAVVQANYSGPKSAPPQAASIWGGEVPPPVTREGGTPPVAPEE